MSSCRPSTFTPTASTRSTSSRTRCSITSMSWISGQDDADVRRAERERADPMRLDELRPQPQPPTPYRGLKRLGMADCTITLCRARAPPVSSASAAVGQRLLDQHVNPRSISGRLTASVARSALPPLLRECRTTPATLRRPLRPQRSASSRARCTFASMTATSSRREPACRYARGGGPYVGADHGDRQGSCIGQLLLLSQIRRNQSVSAPDTWKRREGGSAVRFVPSHFPTSTLSAFTPAPRPPA